MAGKQKYPNPKNQIFRNCLLLGTAISGLAISAPAFAGDITIKSGQHVTTSQVLANAGEKGVVEKGGSVKVNNSGGVSLFRAKGANSTITNNGLMENTGNDMLLIFSDATANGFKSVNTGKLVVNGARSGGMVSQGSDSELVNSGEIMMSGIENTAIAALKNDSKAVNSGEIDLRNGRENVGLFGSGENTTLYSDQNSVIKGSGDSAKGMVLFGKKNSAHNAGLIDLSGEKSYGMFSVSTNSSLHNSGTIRISGRDSEGMALHEGNSTAVNDGTIHIGGGGAFGMFANNRVSTPATNAPVTLINNGIIEGKLPAMAAMANIWKAGRVINNGTIDINGHGIQADGDGILDVINTGKIISRHDLGVGIANLTTGGLVINNGEVRALGKHGMALVVRGKEKKIVTFGGGAQSRGSGRGAHIINNGFASGGSHAVRFFSNDTDDRLTLEKSSVLVGKIDFNGGNDRLDVHKDLSLIYTFVDGPDVINTNGSPFVVVGNKLMVISPESFQISPEIALHMADDVNAVVARQVKNRPHEFVEAEESVRTWMSAAGSAKTFDLSNMGQARSYASGGFVAGVDRAIGPNQLVGGFAGLITATHRAANGQNTQSNGGFVGGYAQLSEWAKVSLTGGYIGQNHNWIVLDNTQETGKRTLASNGHAWIFSPEVSLNAGSFALGNKDDAVSVTPSLRVRYTWQHQSARSENGGLVPIKLDAASTHTLDMRAQLAANVIDTKEASLKLNAGADWRAVWGANQTVLHLGNATHHVSGTNRNQVAGFVGAQFEYTPTEHFELFAGSEVKFAQGQSPQAQVRFGLSGDF